jgi:hypothetical protein
MSFLKMPPQIVRLVLLTIAIVGSYLVARYFLTPPSFGQHGWYRANALEELATRDPVFAGRSACEECHADEVKKLAKAEHKTLSCEGCHGACQAHADKPDVVEFKPPKLGYSVCVRCHEANPSRPKWHKQVNPKTHYNTGEKCTECHVPHQPLEVP